MLPSKNRIQRGEYKKGAQKRRLFRGQLTTVGYMPTETKENSAEPKVGVVISKKVAKSAVARSRLRRRAYSIIKEYGISRLKPGTYMVYMKKDSSYTSYKKLKEEINNVLKEI